MKKLTLLLFMSCATIPGNEKVMRVIFADKENALPYAEEIQMCVPKVDQTLRCMSMMQPIKPKSNNPNKK